MSCPFGIVVSRTAYRPRGDETAEERLGANVGCVAGAAFVLVMGSFVALLVVEVVRNRRRGASWWRVILESRTRPQEWPLFLAAMALLVVMGASLHASWPLAFALPVYGFVAWYLSRHESRASREDLPPFAPDEPISEPDSNVRRLDT
jgi:MFS superfamily sulfate permease-like transporter